MVIIFYYVVVDTELVNTEPLFPEKSELCACEPLVQSIFVIQSLYDIISWQLI